MTPGVRQQLHTREVRSEQCVALRFAQWDGKGRCSSVCRTYAPWAMTSFAACQRKLMHPFYPTTTRGWNDLQNSQPVHRLVLWVCGCAQSGACRVRSVPHCGPGGEWHRVSRGGHHCVAAQGGPWPDHRRQPLDCGRCRTCGGRGALCGRRHGYGADCHHLGGN